MIESNIPEDGPRDDPPSADEDVAKLRLRLRHLSLSQLEEKGLVVWDRDKHIVTKGPEFDDALRKHIVGGVPSGGFAVMEGVIQ